MDATLARPPSLCHYEWSSIPEHSGQDQARFICEALMATQMDCRLARSDSSDLLQPTEMK